MLAGRIHAQVRAGMLSPVDRIADGVVLPPCMLGRLRTVRPAFRQGQTRYQTWDRAAPTFPSRQSIPRPNTARLLAGRIRGFPPQDALLGGLREAPQPGPAH